MTNDDLAEWTPLIDIVKITLLITLNMILWKAYNILTILIGTS